MPGIAPVGQSLLNWMLQAGQKPPSAIFMTVASGSVLEARVLSFSSGFFLASSPGSRARFCSRRFPPLAGSAFAGGGATLRGAGGIVVEFLLEPGHLVARLLDEHL